MRKGTISRLDNLKIPNFASRFLYSNYPLLMERWLDVAFAFSFASPFLVMGLLLLTNSGMVPSEIAASILFIAIPILCLVGMVIGILSLRRHNQLGDESGIVRRKAIAVLLQSIFVLGCLAVLMSLIFNALNKMG
ncbi:MAG: hypothetical protein IPL33_13730 [Sphingobacteriales bacterium]|nr:hypothetical protein [Sphingobacteriales bacterium]